MSFKPTYVVVDFETEENGHGSTEFYKPMFRVSSAAFSWIDKDGKIKSEFVRGENQVGYFFERIIDSGIPVVAHNAQFEMGVIGCRYPKLANRVVWLADTMRLVQNFDNGGDKFAMEVLPPLSLDEQLEQLESDSRDEESGKPKKKKDRKPKSISGLGLTKAIRRILKRPDHKEKAHQWLRGNVPECKGKRLGSYLNRLPPGLLRDYNIGDTEETLRLYVYLTDFFKSIKYDWRKDHALYFNSVKLLVGAKIEGVPVEREGLRTYRDAVEKEIEEIGTLFKNRFAEPIKFVERGRLLDEVRKRKTLKGRCKFVRRVKGDSAYRSEKVGFNVGSNKQLASLFVDQLKLPVKFITAKGQPAFRSAVLESWGDGGTMLKARRKRLLVLKQAESLLALSAFDNNWHLDIKACGTSTGRMAGGQHG